MVEPDALFERAPPIALQQRVGLVTPHKPNIRGRVLLVVLAGWLPLLLLAILQSLWTHSDKYTSLLWEVGVHARYLVAAPLLVLAESLCAPQLNAIAQYFMSGTIVDGVAKPRLQASVGLVRRMLGSAVVEGLVLILAYLVALAAALSHSSGQLPVWAQPAGGMPRFSLAGWWHTLVSLPLLLMLILGWIRRLIAWT
jgi:hypothetical protein